MNSPIAYTFVLCSLLALVGCGGTGTAAPERGQCVDVTSLDGDRGNDVWCTRDDGTHFYTNYGGAHLWESKHVLPY